MSAVRDIAQKSGVSISTVSLVLNNKPGISEATRRRVLEVAGELGYQTTARSRARAKPANLLFLLYKKHGQIVADTPFFSNVLEGVDAAVKKLGFQLMVTYIEESADIEEQLQKAIGADCSGIILLATEMSRSDLAPFTSKGLPIVVLDSYFEEITEDSVVINNMQGAFTAVLYLFQKGHTQIGHLKSRIAINNFLERKDGFKKALKACKLPYNPQYTFRLGTTIDSAYADMKALLADSPKLPTAFFADNDIIAIGAMRALKEAGYRIPQDVSIIGFDDIPTCELMDPPLTSIRVPKSAIGEIAVSRLASLVEHDPGVRVKIEVRTELAERGSVCPPPESPL